MLTKEEEKFLADWEATQGKEKSFFQRYRFGFAIGLIMGIGILLNFISGWYTRATMVANSQSTPLVLIVAVLLIIIFYGVFYSRHHREMNEQRYKELKLKKEKEHSIASMQHDSEINSQ